MAGLHSTCRGLALLITSREPLNLAAEQCVIVAPLAVPALEAPTVGEIESVAGSALFLAAVRRRNSRFVLDATAAPAIAEICARLDGLPLALEQLQRAFVEFAIFAGGATLDAAWAVTGADLGTVEALVSKSLIERRRQSDGATRLVMLETIRHYALGRLLATPEREAIHRRHCEHYLELVERALPRLSTRDEQAALAALDAELDNLRSALHWALHATPETSLRLAGRLGAYWRLRSDLEGLQWLKAALQAGGEHAPLTDRARARHYHAHQLSLRNDGAAAIDGMQTAVALYRRANDHAGVSETLSALASAVGVFSGDLAGERRCAREACHHARLAGDDGLLGVALGRLAAVAGDERRTILEQAAELLIPLGNYREVAGAYSTAAYVALTEESLGRSHEAARDRAARDSEGRRPVDDTDHPLKSRSGAPVLR
ncbi:MAG: hypothetical protein M3076_05660 [Actinomycetota bacterium]|nr:hypothetical protein [Actinomycetota bacterium]